MSEPSEIKCPNCGANLGESRDSGEYRCGFCGYVSHAGRLRPAYERTRVVDVGVYADRIAANAVLPVLVDPADAAVWTFEL